MASWGGHVFRDHDVWWIWGPWAAVITGGLCGGFVYDYLIFTGEEEYSAEIAVPKGENPGFREGGAKN